MISCTQPSDCPGANRCDVDLGFCLPNDPGDLSPPAILGTPVFSTTVVAGDDSVEVHFEVSESLLLPPVVSLRSGSYSAEWRRIESSTTETTFVYQFTISGTEPEGVAIVEADLVGRTGVQVDDVLLGEIELDFTPPVVNAVTFVGAITASGNLWVESPALTVNLDVTDAGPGGVVTVDVEGDLATTASVTYSSTLDLVLSSSDGAKALSLVFFRRSRQCIRVIRGGVESGTEHSRQHNCH